MNEAYAQAYKAYEDACKAAKPTDEAKVKADQAFEQADQALKKAKKDYDEADEALVKAYDDAEDADDARYKADQALTKVEDEAQKEAYIALKKKHINMCRAYDKIWEVRTGYIDWQDMESSQKMDQAYEAFDEAFNQAQKTQKTLFFLLKAQKKADLNE